MKLLLTSAGFTNDSIVRALGELVGGPFEGLKLAFIPTAANVENGDKGWLVEDLNNCRKLNFSQIDIVDISALPLDVFRPRLMEAEVIFVGGGNTLHLMNWVRQSGLENELTELMSSRVYVGLSAGSMIVSKWWSGVYDKKYYDEPDEVGRYPCLGWVNFHIIPHYSNEMFPKINGENMRKLGEEIKEPLYVLDDQTAVKVNGDKIVVVSEGKWEKFD